MSFIGRAKESAILDKIIRSNQAEFAVVYGRRRVGKTALIQHCVVHRGIYLECTGLKDGKLKDQLLNFSEKFSAVFYSGVSLQQPTSWRKAFELLTVEAKKVPKSKKLIVFLDELPWLASPKSNLMQNLDYYWNTEWSKLSNFKLIVCGSAASWMLDHLVNAKGGLHNRITQSILVEPFNLADTKKFLAAKKIRLSEKQVLDLYMVMGGIPYYLNYLDHAKSISQNINDMCFKKDGVLYSEFSRLFKSLFEAAELNLLIVKEIAKYRYGISFIDLAKKLDRKLGGRFSERLSELEAAGFIQHYLPFGKKKRDRYYRVVDEYTLFYLDWISEVVDGKSVPSNVDYWSTLSKMPAWMSWSGYSFESICFKHIDKIIDVLNLRGVACLASPWRYLPNPNENAQGAQIDLLLERSDNAITLCEMKYSANPFVIDKNCAINLMRKLETFQGQLKQSKQVFIAFITTMGLKKNHWSEELVHHVISLSDLF